MVLKVSGYGMYVKIHRNKPKRLCLKVRNEPQTSKPSLLIEAEVFWMMKNTSIFGVIRCLAVRAFTHIANQNAFTEMKNIT